MGWDISYHPISEEQIRAWYFDVLDNLKLIENLAYDNKIDDFYKEKYRDVINVGLKTNAEDSFDLTHGYFVAVIQGFFQKYFYVRGAALSFLENQSFKKYYKEWAEIVSSIKLTSNVKNKIVTNYCSGVYIPKNKVVDLLNDYENNNEIRNELNVLFSHNRIKVLLKALNFAKENELGLLEATEVIEPNPLNLNDSSCYSNLFNCDPEGAILYQQATMEQFSEIEKSQNLKAGEISKNATYTITNIEPIESKENKGFWKKLFGK